MLKLKKKNRANTILAYSTCNCACSSGCFRPGHGVCSSQYQGHVWRALPYAHASAQGIG